MKTGFALTVFLFASFGSHALAEQATTGPLAEYVAKKDDSYRWVKRRHGTLGKTAYAELILTSQTWRGVVWKHQLFVINPSSTPAKTEHALLFITGGSWKNSLEEPSAARETLPRDARLFAALAEQLKTPVAVLLHVPQQPMFDGKKEDAIIALTFEKFLRTGEADWPLLLPMVKSAVRGMDATQELVKQDWSLDIKTFTVTGASKRGWTTWLTGAVDKRAVAIAPMVIDMLNMVPQLKHQKDAWGDLSYKINDYSERGLHKHLESDSGKVLRSIVDPYSYRKLLTQPKLIIIGTNDHYWPLDALDFYWSDLVGEKHILYVPNNRHGLNDLVRLSGSLNAFHQSAVSGTPLPKLSWKFKNGNATLGLRIKSDQEPQDVRVWTASSKTRDFREAKWTSKRAEGHEGGFVHSQAIPESGYMAIFGEAVYESDRVPYFLSTNVKIVQSPAEAAE